MIPVPEYYRDVLKLSDAMMMIILIAEHQQPYNTENKETSGSRYHVMDKLSPAVDELRHADSQRQKK